VFFGEKKISGYFIKITDIHAFEKDKEIVDSIVIEAVFFSPHPYKPIKNQASSPWTAIKIKRADLPKNISKIKFSLLLKGTIYSHKDATKIEVK
jgi:hypothetical protein